MKYYEIEPEVAGGMGGNCVFERTDSRGSLIIKLHYQFDGWLGDDLLAGAGAFIVTQSLANALTKSHLSGFIVGELEVSKSGEFEDFYPNRKLPPFRWLQISGNPRIDDFGLAQNRRLIISDRALRVLRTACISNAIVTKVDIG